ncbi:MAG: SDR family oxidoreductase [Elusimicrobia bacterium]|nr:SDR family oxidoreductase [Elusimicrobiota bacterium]
MRQRTVLVTGGTGLLGKGLEETAPAGVRLISIHQRDYRVKGSRAEHRVLDVRDEKGLRELFSSVRFDAVIHAAGLASVDYVEKHPEEARGSNVTGTSHIARLCREQGAHLIYVSTNAVFDGKKAPYRETDPINPVNAYGRIKAECEEVARRDSGSWTIARPILMYGWNHVVTRPNTATWIYDKLLKGESLKLVDDVYENPLYNIQCARALWACVERKPGGVFHLAGKDTLNRHEFGLKLAGVFGLDASLIEAVDSSHFPSIAPRPPNTSFVTERMERELGVSPMTVEQGLAAMKDSMEIVA